MKHLTLTCVLISSAFFGGCSRNTYPTAQLTPLKIEQPASQFQSPYQEIATADVPLKKKAAERIIVMLDAGHGGEDFGTHSLGNPRYQEKYLNLSTTQLVKNFLQQFGYEVLMTRTDDTFIALDKRALFANEQKPRLFVSIHFNSAPSTDAEGIEVFYYKNEEDKQRMNKSKVLAQAILDKTIQNTKAKSRGVKHGNYAVIRETKMPAVLIEGGFLTNTSEMEKIKNAAYLKSLALGIAQGVQDYLAKDGILAER
jgi:N-acetylmuramoyl-L-alanine amidase